MRFKEYLQEEFYGSRKMRARSKGEIDIEFFVNPKPTEMNDVFKASGTYKCIRFFVDFKKKEVVIWEGSVLHDTAMKSLKSMDIYSSKPDLFFGSADYKSGKMYILYSDYLEGNSDQKYIDKIMSKIEKNGKWLSKYFSNVPEFLNRLHLIFKY